MEKNMIEIQNGIVYEMIRPNGSLSGIFLKEYPATIAMRLGLLQQQMAQVGAEIEREINGVYEKYASKIKNPDGTFKYTIPEINKKKFDEETDKIINKSSMFEFEPFLFAEIKNLQFTPTDIVSMKFAGLLK